MSAATSRVAVSAAPRFTGMCPMARMNLSIHRLEYSSDLAMNTGARLIMFVR
jgi:hypothetical protein